MLKTNEFLCKINVLHVKAFLCMLHFFTVKACHKPPRYVPYKCTYVPYNGTFGASTKVRC
jgi:hypothetical protein